MKKATERIARSSQQLVAAADETNEIDVSIVICTRNRADRLSGTLQALRSLSTSRSYEVIWVDNASTDSTSAVLQRELANDRLSRYVSEKQIGLGAARNFGWKNTRGKIVAFTDDDCYPSPDYVDALISAFADRPDAGVIGGRIMLYNPQHANITIDEGRTSRAIARASFVTTGVLQGANLAFRREALEAIKGIDPDLGAGTPFPCEDADAVAAVVWAGFNAYFDPRPTVEHDHGRVDLDVPALLASYDRGRGSYYAKYILRRDTRAAFLLGWLGSAWHRRDWLGVRTLRTEMITAAQYAISKKKYGILTVAVPVGIAVLSLQSAVACLSGLGNRLRRLQNR